MITPEQDKYIEDIYHGILKHLNRISNHPIMKGIPQLQEDFKNAAELLIELRKITRESLQNSELKIEE